MMISDKQELRRCVKQMVRRADVCEASLSFDTEHGEMGVEAMLDLWARPALTPSDALARAAADHTPFHEDAAAMFAALDALDFPVKDLNRAQVMQREYERGAYLREILDVMRAKCVLVRVPMEKAGDLSLCDDRFEPLMEVDAAVFTPGRYGVDYAGAAKRIADAAALCSSRNIVLKRMDEQAMRYCLMPLCQDQGYTIHVHLSSKEELAQFTMLLDAFEGVHALVSCEESLQRALIDEAVVRVRMLVQLTDETQILYALGRLGTRFVPYSANARLPEQMLGRWIAARETIWQALCEAYLPLARTGYVLDSTAIERDIRKLLSGNLLSLCRAEHI